MSAQFIRSEFEDIEMQHRYEDRALIVEVLQTLRPRVAIELGTAAGGFASLLARTLEEWDGIVYTADKIDCPNADVLLGRHPNLSLVRANVLEWSQWPAVLRTRVTGPNVLVYCDNGNKPREIEIVAPRLLRGSIIGTHDYGTEVPIDWVEPYLEGLGYQTLWHDRFAALAHPEFYPESLTRFWIRIE